VEIELTSVAAEFDMFTLFGMYRILNCMLSRSQNVTAALYNLRQFNFHHVLVFRRLFARQPIIYMNRCFEV